MSDEPLLVEQRVGRFDDALLVVQSFGFHGLRVHRMEKVILLV